MTKENLQNKRFSEVNIDENRLKTGLEKAYTTHDSIVELLHSENPIDTKSLPFTLLPHHNFHDQETDDARFDAQLALSDVAEQLHERTIPTIESMITAVESVNQALSMDEQIAMHQRRIEKMQEKYEKGLFPEKSLRDAEEKLTALKEKNVQMSVVALQEIINHQASRVERIRRGRARNLFTDDTLRKAENELANYTSQYAAITGEQNDMSKSGVQTETLKIEVLHPVSQTFKTTETPPFETSPQDIKEEILDSEALADEFYATFSDTISTQLQESFFSFLTNAIRNHDGKFTVSSLSNALYHNPQYSKKARVYMQTLGDKFYYRDWEIKSDSSVKDGYSISKIQESSDEDFETRDSSPIEGISSENNTTSQEWYKKEIAPSRMQAISYITETDDWSVQTVLTILGPSMKTNRPLTWIQAYASLVGPLNKIYARVNHQYATDEELRIWQSITQKIGVEGKEALKVFRTSLLQEFRDRKDQKDSNEKAETSTNDTVQTILTPDEINSFGELLSQLHGIHIPNHGMIQTFVVDEYILKKYQQKNEQNIDQQEKEKLQEQALNKIKKIFSEYSQEEINSILDEQDEEGFILLYFIAENNEAFDKSFLDIISEMRQMNEHPVTQLEETIEITSSGSIIFEHFGEPSSPKEEMAEIKAISETPKKNGTKEKTKRIERELPDINFTLQAIVSSAFSDAPATMNIGQLRALHHQLAVVAEYAFNHNYITGERLEFHDFTREELVLLQFLRTNKTILKQPKLVKELKELVKEAYQTFVKNNPRQNK